MNEQKTLSAHRRLWQALNGVLFALGYFGRDFILSRFATGPFLMPDAPDATSEETR